MNLDFETLYQAHLNRVSRSFAFCIKELKSPLREWVGLSYILCRVVDTIEDAVWDSRIEQEAMFDLFHHSILNSDFDVTRIAPENFPDGIPVSEIELLRDYKIFHQDFHRLETEVKTCILDCVLSMEKGMRYFCLRESENKKIRIVDLGEANLYCFFVAGIVGELMSRLFVLSEPHGSHAFSKDFLYLGLNFGLFLQKINLLKDQMKDEKEGRYLVSSRTEYMNDLFANARESIKYILSIPLNRSDYRIFCAWSLFIGLASVPHIVKAWQTKDLNGKIGRIETGLIIAKVKLNVDDNQKLQKYFDELLQTAVVSSEIQNIESENLSAKPIEVGNSESLPEYFLNSYQGKLDLTDHSYLHSLFRI